MTWCCVKFTLSTIYIFFALVSSAFAEELLRHQEVIITANPIAADDIDTEFQTGRVTVISSDEFESDVATVADVLRKETGIQIRQSSGLGSYSSVSVRGSTSAQVNVYLDGVLVNSASGGTVDLSQFHLSGVDSIEIYRGNVPVQLGAAGIGGAININTKNASKKDRRQVTVGLGSYDTKKASLSLSGGNTQTRYLSAFESLSSDNNYSLINDGQTTNNSNNNREESRQNAEFKQLSALMTVNHSLSNRWRVNAVAQHFDKHNGIPNVINDPNNTANLGIENSNFQLKLEQTLNPQAALTYLLYGSHRKTRYDDLQNKVGLSANLEKSKTNTFGFKTDYAQSYGSHLFNVSAQFRNEAYRAEDFLKPSVQEVERSEFILALQDEWLSPSGEIMVSSRASARNFMNDFKNTNQKKDKQHFIDWHVGMRYQLNDQTVFRTNFSRDIRTPSLSELYGDTGAAIGNEDLKEEQAWNGDLGINIKWDSLAVNSALFYRELNNAIVVTYDSRGIGQADNISKARVFGVEIEAISDMAPWWYIGLKMTSQESEVQSGIPSSIGNPLPGQYDYVGSLFNNFSVNSLEYIFEYEHRSGGFYDSGAVAALPVSNQFHFTLNYRLNAHRFELQVKNLGDARISDFNRFPGPGRRVFLTYAYTF